MLELVALPAFGCDERLYAPVANGLAGSVRVQTIIAGASRMAGCVDEILAQAPPKFIVLGTSFGGRIALETALAAPSRVMGLVVIGAGAGAVADKVAGDRRTTRILGGEMEAVLQEMGDMISYLPGPNGPAVRDLFVEMGRQAGSGLLARQSEALAHRTDLWPRLGELACPALMLWGLRDQFSPAADGLRMSTLMPRGRYVEIPDCGHFPTLEAPEESTGAISHWLQDSQLA